MARFTLLSSADKRHAKDALSILYIEGKLSSESFVEKSSEVDSAQFINDLEDSFSGLPGGLPFYKDSDGALVPKGSRVKYLERAEQQYPEFYRRADLAKSFEVGIVAITTVAFLILFFVFKLPFSWLIWMTIPFTILLPRMILKVSVPELQAYEAWKEDNIARLKNS